MTRLKPLFAYIACMASLDMLALFVRCSAVTTPTEAWGDNPNQKQRWTTSLTSIYKAKYLISRLNPWLDTNIK